MSESEIEHGDRDQGDRVQLKFREDDLVGWAGGPNQTRYVLSPGHPGIVKSADSVAMTVHWIDKDGLLDPHENYQQDWLKSTSQRDFDFMVHKLRSGDWSGIPYRTITEDDGGPEPLYTVGDVVAWAGPSRAGELRIPDPETYRSSALLPGHPGVVTFDEPEAMLVNWVDKEGVFNPDAVFQQEWLERLSVDEFNRRADELRSSDWPGFGRHEAH